MRTAIAIIVLMFGTSAMAQLPSCAFDKKCTIGSADPFVERNGKTIVELNFNCAVPSDLTACRVQLLASDQTIPARFIAIEHVTGGVVATRALLEVDAVDIDSANSYRLHFRDVVTETEPNGRVVDLTRKTTATIDVETPNDLFVANFGVPIDSVTDVSITVDTVPVTPARVTISGGPDRDSLRMLFAQPLPADSVVKISAQSSTAGASSRMRNRYGLEPGDRLRPVTRTVEHKVAFTAPASPELATLSLKLSVEAARDSKPAFLGSIVGDLSRRNTASRCFGRLSCTSGPVLTFEGTTQDVKGNNKGSLGYRGRLVQGIGSGPLYAISYSAGAMYAAEKSFANRNGLVELRSTFFFTPFVNRKLETPLAIEPRLAIGVDLGRNFGLQKKYADVDDFDIRRGVVEASLELARNLKSRNVQAVSFSATWTGRHLFADEPDSIFIPEEEREEGGDAFRVISRDGRRDNFKTTLTLKIATFFAIEAEWQNGKTPIFYERTNKFTFAWKFSY